MLREMAVKLRRNFLILTIVLLIITIALLAKKWDTLNSIDRDSQISTDVRIDQVVDHEIIRHEPSIDVDSTAIQVVLIFRHGSLKIDLQNKFKVAVESLLQHTTSPLRLHIVTDADSYKLATTMIDQMPNSHTKSLKVVHVPTEGVDVLSGGVTAEMVGMLQEFFTSHRDAYYRDPLFFFSLFLQDILPGLRRIILMDIDVRMEADITELHALFDRFQPHHVMGMSHELSPTYRHALARYRQQHPTTALGSPPSEGGFPGYNSGVMLIDIPRLNSSTIISSYLEKALLQERCEHYSFQGTLGDQDLYTLIALDHPDLFYTLPCTWNRQLCEWWRSRGYSQVFDQYFSCTGKIKIFHGNCKSLIPDVPSPHINVIAH